MGPLVCATAEYTSFLLIQDTVDMHLTRVIYKKSITLMLRVANLANTK